MREEIMQILKMIEEGKISAEQGAQLMEAGNISQEGTDNAKMESSNAKWLKVRVYDLQTNKNKVNVSIPISLISVGLKIGMKFGLDKKELEGIDFNEILQMIKAGEEGKLVDVTDEEKFEKVEVYVE